MAIANYTDLQAAVTNWLNRSDLASRIPEFIALGEADMRRNLRLKSTYGVLTLTAGSDVVTLPSLAAEVRSIRLDTANYQHALRLTTPAVLADLRQVASGLPHYYAVIDLQAHLDRPADIAYVCEIVYYEKLAILTGGAPTNATLTDSPDLYLYAALKEAAPYLEHDERNPMWAQKYRQALEDENIRRERVELGGAPLNIGLPVVFG